MLIQYDRHQTLPTAKDLPDSDETPVDNELQDLIPHLLKDTLALIWPERMDWFFGVDMGIYYHPDQPAIIPDGFLSVGVPRIIDEGLRLSYVLWEEEKLPILVIEVVSQKRRGEYTTKKQDYADLGILYYVIYNPLRKRKPTLEVYQLINGDYQLMNGEPIWLSEIGLGIGKQWGSYLGIEREWLYWYNESRRRYLIPAERIEKGRQEGKQEGIKEGKQELILRLIEQKFTNLPLRVEQKIKQLSGSQLDQLALALLGFSQLAELDQYLDNL
ncbi:MAG: DUF4351 domain-containing protein [Microcystaceae cyanobacterium]